MSLKPFHFKQFNVEQDLCAMKIGTDAVLLGAWTSLDKNPQSILDIGAGTGVLALMLAQRSQAMVIDGLEIDEAAHIQCMSNFEHSPWADRLFCYHASLLEFTQEWEDTYDLIISNPPFFTEDYKSNDTPRNTARFADSMPFEHLIACSAQLLADDGTLSVVLPFEQESGFTQMAITYGLFPTRICRVKGHASSPVKRSLIELCLKAKPVLYEDLIIEHERQSYTTDYIDLTKEFYLNM